VSSYADHPSNHRYSIPGPFHRSEHILIVSPFRAGRFVAICRERIFLSLRAARLSLSILGTYNVSIAGWKNILWKGNRPFLIAAQFVTSRASWQTLAIAGGGLGDQRWRCGLSMLSKSLTSRCCTSWLLVSTIRPHLDMKPLSIL
jgi:hypothetical protein